jgi:hypothetical protein
MNDSRSVDGDYAPQVKAPVCGLHDKFNVLCRSIRRCYFMRKTEHTSSLSSASSLPSSVAASASASASSSILALSLPCKTIGGSEGGRIGGKRSSSGVSTALLKGTLCREQVRGSSCDSSLC